MLQPKQVRKLANYLNRLNDEEISFMRKTISKALTRHISVFEAANYNKLVDGQKVVFVDKQDNTHEGTIEKVNYKFVRVVAEDAKKFYILPDMIKRIVQ